MHGGVSSDKCDSYYMQTRQSQHIRKATYYNTLQHITKYRQTNTSNNLQKGMQFHQQEADIRIFLHVKHASSVGYTNISMQIVDSNSVLVIDATLFHRKLGLINYLMNLAQQQMA